MARTTLVRSCSTLPERPQRPPSSVPPGPRVSGYYPHPEQPHLVSLGSGAKSFFFLRASSADDQMEVDDIRKVAEMGRQLETLKVRSSRPFESEFNVEPLFSSQIMNEAVPLRFKILQAEPYNRTNNPLDHLESFKALMLLHRAIDGILCQAFLATLRKVARLWFSSRTQVVSILLSSSTIYSLLISLTAADNAIAWTLILALNKKKVSPSETIPVGLMQPHWRSLIWIRRLQCLQ